VQASDFTADSPGRLVPIGQGELAFVPEPMPTAVALDAPTQRLLSEADYALGRLAGAAGRVVNPYLIGQPLLRREAILSSRIEGTQTTPEQLVLLELGISPQAPDGPEAADTQEVLNYVLAMELGLRRLGEIPLSLRLVRELHAALLADVRAARDRPGQLRDVQNYISVAGTSLLLARYVPPPMPEMKEALERWEEDLHRGAEHLPLLVHLALSHYQFEAIHPFRDRNGRVGRLLIPLTLCAQGRLEQPLLYMSAYFEAHRREYVDRLLRVSTHGDWLGWVSFFVRGVAECASDGLVLAQQLIDLRERYLAQVRPARSAGALARLVDELFRVPSITIGRATELLGATPASASANLAKLAQLGVVAEVTGRQRNQVFVAHEILAFVGREARLA
jgi:Fic family protein